MERYSLYPVEENVSPDVEIDTGIEHHRKCLASFPVDAHGAILLVDHHAKGNDEIEHLHSPEGGVRP